MKKILFILIIALTSCQKNDQIISEIELLKDIPEQFFNTKTTQIIQGEKDVYNYKNNFRRLPNTEFSKFYLKKHPDTYLPYFNVTINLSKNKTITLEGATVLQDELLSYTKEYIDFAADGKPALIHLNFDEHLTLKDYITFIRFIKPITNKDININTKVFIYNKAELPDCDCTL